MTGIDAGDEAYRHGDTVQMPCSTTPSAGDAVKIDGSGNLTETTANGDPIVGILSEGAPSSAGDPAAVHVRGAVYATADTADNNVTAGDLLQPSDADNGKLEPADSNEGLVTAVDEGGSDTYDIYTKYAMALEDQSTDDGLVKVLLG